MAIVHPAAFVEAVREERGATGVAEWEDAATIRENAGLQRILDAMHGGAALYERPVDRNLGGTGDAAKEREAAALLDSGARLVDGVLRVTGEF